MDDLAAEFEALVLSDKRLTARYRELVETASSNPSASFPQMLQDAADLEGAYRLFSNRNVKFEPLLAPHIAKTRDRAERGGDIVVVHDTTSIETPCATPEEVGYLNTGKTGYRAHVSLAMQVEPCRPARPLGVLAVQADFQAKPPSYGRKRKKKKKKSGAETARSTDKAYLRWERGIEASSRLLQRCNSVIHVADREADSYALFWKVLELGDGCVLRLRNDRRARRAEDEDLFDDDGPLLSEIAAEMTGQFERTVPLSKRGDKAAPRSKKTHPPREARGATLHYSAVEVELQRPGYLPKTTPEGLRLWLVRAWEPTPPEGEDPVAWVLLTTEPCTTEDQIMRVVDLYRSRWLIEDFFKTLKTVCNLEERHFESRHALLNVLALFLPVAVHVLWMRACARDTPDIPATEVFSPLQLEVLTHCAHRKMPKNPTVVQAIWVLAGFGGHIANNGWPGIQVLARAFIRLQEAVRTWQAAQAALRPVGDLING